MLLMTIVYDNDIEDIMSDIIDDINDIKSYFELKNISIGAVESVENNIHFIKIFCDSENFNEKTRNMFNFYLANILYKLIVKEFCKKDIENFIEETYFFLDSDEIDEIKNNIYDALMCEGNSMDDNKIYCINRKNSAVEKIIKCIEENREINVKGFITFRMKEIKSYLESIVDKVIEKYIVDREYSEFIKLLKYFVEIQESKIEEVHIVIGSNGNYFVKDKEGNNIIDKFLGEFTDSKHTGMIGMEDVIISGLITNSPERIVIHYPENCINKEFIDTIKNVFTGRVKFCDDCKVKI